MGDQLLRRLAAGRETLAATYVWTSGPDGTRPAIGPSARNRPLLPRAQRTGGEARCGGRRVGGARGHQGEIPLRGEPLGATRQ